jgi:xylan 1,4-beta-xylosidase
MLRLAFLAALLIAALSPAADYVNPVLPGDYPDPSVIRVGDEYWATATSSQWAPVFPLLRSRDLVNWELVGHVFPKPPSWSVDRFWAPEITYHNNRVLIYYTARRRGGPLCVAVATAERPMGPYTDHGPMVCQEMGSIDGVAVDDENGSRYLVWKEDGNSRKQPTILWAQPLSADGTQLTGEPVEIMRNDPQSWERNVIEGAFFVRRDGRFHLFYSGAGCCGVNCTYALGVAWSENLLGPYERHPRNPILPASEQWKCPGHGSIVDSPDGRLWLLYHAYDARASIFVGRQGLLDEVTWDAEGWPVVRQGTGPSSGASVPWELTPAGSMQISPGLHPRWQWPPGTQPDVRFESTPSGHWMRVTAAGTGAAATVLGVPPTAADYDATIEIDRSNLAAGTQPGMAAYGNRENALGVALTQEGATLWSRRQKQEQTLARVSLPSAANMLLLRMSVREGRHVAFSYSTDGQQWTTVAPALEGGHLPPWDLATRIVLVCGGEAPGAACRFGPLSVVNVAP